MIGPPGASMISLGLARRWSAPASSAVVVRSADSPCLLPAPAGPCGGHLVGQVVVGERHRVDHRHVDVLADTQLVAQAQRGEHADDAVQPGDGVGHRDLDVERQPAVGCAPAGDDAGLGVDHAGVGGPIALRTVLAEPGDRQHHEARVERREIAPGEPVAGHDPGPEVLQHDVGRRGEAAHEGAPRRVAQVDGDRPLAGVLLAEVRRLGSLAERARDVTLGRLDLDDVSAEVGEHAPGERAGEDTAQVEDLHAVQWVRHRRPPPRSRGRQPVATSSPIMSAKLRW